MAWRSVSSRSARGSGASPSWASIRPGRHRCSCRRGIRPFPARPSLPNISMRSGAPMAERRLLPQTMDTRVEVRRLTGWFNDKFFEEVSGPLVTERVYKLSMPAEQGGGSPDSHAIRAARKNIGYHLAYIEWLLGRRDWLAGDRMSYADLAAAAQLSIADYLGDVPWNDDGAA